MTTQLFISFIVGGCVVTFLSLLAEKSSEHIAGIIMMFPSTIVLGFFFLGLTTSAQKVASIVPATLIPLGIVIFSSVIYIFFATLYARYTSVKMVQILLSFISTSLVWFVLAAPFAVFKFNHLPLGLVGYFIFIALAHYFLNRNKVVNKPTRPPYTKLQMAFRAMFIGFIIALVVFLGKELDPFWGGVFTLYPAVTLASLITFHYYYHPSQLSWFMKRAPIGSLSILVYDLVTIYFFPKFGVALGTLFCYLVSLSFSLLMVKHQKRKAWKYLQKQNASY